MIPASSSKRQTCREVIPLVTVIVAVTESSGSGVAVGSKAFVGTGVLVGSKAFVGTGVLVGSKAFVGTGILVGSKAFVGTGIAVGVRAGVTASCVGAGVRVAFSSDKCTEDVGSAGAAFS